MNGGRDGVLELIEPIDPRPKRIAQDAARRFRSGRRGDGRGDLRADGREPSLDELISRLQESVRLGGRRKPSVLLGLDSCLGMGRGCRDLSSGGHPSNMSRYRRDRRSRVTQEGSRLKTMSRNGRLKFSERFHYVPKYKGFVVNTDFAQVLAEDSLCGRKRAVVNTTCVGVAKKHLRREALRLYVDNPLDRGTISPKSERSFANSISVDMRISEVK